MSDAAKFIELSNALKAFKVKRSTWGSLSIGQMKGLIQQGITDVNSFASSKPHNLAQAGLTPEQQAEIGAALASVQDLESVIQAERRYNVADTLKMMSFLEADLDNNEDGAPLPPPGLKKSMHDLKNALEAWESRQ